MTNTLLLATSHGLIVCQRGEDVWREIRRGLTNQHVTSVIARAGVILAGTREGVYRSDDMGETWRQSNQGLSVRHIRWLAYHPDHSDFELAGMEPAAIFVSRDGAQTWRECPEVAQLREVHGWRLPYSPAAGCVRGFAIKGSHAYAAVEDGCVLASEDGGESWRLAEGSRGDPDHAPQEGYIHSDLHSIAVHPASPLLVYAPTGGGFYRSMDGGKTWDLRYSRCYSRAVWVDAEDSEHMILGPADGVDRNGRIEESHDGGHTWQPASQNLDTPWHNHMVERFERVGEDLFAVLSNGELLVAPLSTLSWQGVLPDILGVNAVTSMNL